MPQISQFQMRYQDLQGLEDKDIPSVSKKLRVIDLWQGIMCFKNSYNHDLKKNINGLNA
jgi:hypothetical protein